MMHVIWNPNTDKWLYFSGYVSTGVRNLCWVDDHELSSPIEGHYVDLMFEYVCSTVLTKHIGDIYDYVINDEVFVVPVWLRRDVYELEDQGGARGAVIKYSEALVVDYCDYGSAERLWK